MSSNTGVVETIVFGFIELLVNSYGIGRLCARSMKSKAVTNGPLMPVKSLVRASIDWSFNSGSAW